jgi:hypothetical protein
MKNLDKKLIKRSIGYYEYNPDEVCKTCFHKHHTTAGYKCDLFSPSRFKVSENGSCNQWKPQDDAVSNGE